MENLRNCVDIKIVRSNETDKIRKLVASPLYTRHKIFTNNLAGIDMRKSRLLLNKPVYVGMTILDNSKILMYDFYYNELKARYTEQGASSSTQTQTVCSWQYRQKTSTKTWRKTLSAMIQAITPKSTNFIQKRTRRCWAK